MIYHAYIVSGFFLFSVKIQFYRELWRNERFADIASHRIACDEASHRHTWLGFTDGAFSLSLHFSGREFRICEGRSERLVTAEEEEEEEEEEKRETRQRAVVRCEREKEGLL